MPDRTEQPPFLPWLSRILESGGGWLFVYRDSVARLYKRVLTDCSSMCAPRMRKTGDARPWSTFHVRWRRLTPPLRPDPAVCDAVTSLVADKCDRALLLGATPELTRVASRVASVEWKRETLAFVWPGNDAGRQAVQADWRELPYGDASFSCAIGDGSLNCLEYPRGYRHVGAELSR